ncbi:hypothetical protein [Moumouvirus maliensis]|nr:hypothetical protein [Moumouvirus maliensis]
MSRKKITENMIKYLEDTLNCQNVMKYLDERETKKNIINIDSINIYYEIVNYNDSDRDLSENNDQTNIEITRNDVEKIFTAYDIMTEANYTGLEYFPYIYGVLDCRDNINSKFYLFRENFQGILPDLIKNIEHPSDWYDVLFQVILINYYLRDIVNINYKSKINKYLFNKLPKPYYKEYHLGDHIININHKYLIVLWDPENLIQSDTDINQVNINMDFLLEYIQNSDIKVPPSNRIIKLINDIQSSDNNIPNIINEYYNVS